MIDCMFKLPFLLLQMTLRRALSPMLPNLDAQLVPYSRSRAGHSANRPVASAPHPPPITADSPVQGGVHLLGDFSYTAHHHQGERQGDLPSHLPLASEFSLNSIEGHKPVLQQAGKEEARIAAGVSAQPSHQQLPSQIHLASAGVEPDATGFGAWPSHAASNSQDTPAAQTPQGSAPTPKEELATQQGNSRMFSDRQQQPHSQHQQPHDGHMGTDGAVSVKPGRVIVDTAGSVRRTVITVAELQSTAQPEAYLAQRAHDKDPVTNRLASSASASASQCVVHAAAGAQPNVAQPTHAHTSQVLSAQPSAPAARLSQQLQSHASQSQDRALQNSSALNSADHPANSPPHEGKASSKGPAQQQVAVRRSDNADAVLHSQEAILESALVNAIQDVQHAQDDKAVASAVQALQLQTSHASSAAVQVYLPQVCSLHKCMRACMICVCACVRELEATRCD